MKHGHKNYVNIYIYIYIYREREREREGERELERVREKEILRLGVLAKQTSNYNILVQLLVPDIHLFRVIDHRNKLYKVLYLANDTYTRKMPICQILYYVEQDFVYD